MSQQITYNRDGTFDAVFVTPHDSLVHHFHASISQAGYGKLPDGSIDNRVVTTGTLTCTDTGCGQTIDTAFSLFGDGVAQQAHAMYRYATSGGTLTLQQAAQSVINDVELAGGVVKINTNGEVV